MTQAASFDMKATGAPRNVSLYGQLSRRKFIDGFLVPSKNAKSQVKNEVFFRLGRQPPVDPYEERINQIFISNQKRKMLKSYNNTLDSKQQIELKLGGGPPTGKLTALGGETVDSEVKSGIKSSQPDNTKAAQPGFSTFTPTGQAPPTPHSQHALSFDEVNINSRQFYRNKLTSLISAKQNDLKNFETLMKAQRKFYLPNIKQAVDTTKGKYTIESLHDPSIVQVS